MTSCSPSTARSPEFTRRECLLTGAAVLGATAITAPVRAADTGSPDHPFRYCLNTSTIRGQKLPIVEEVELVAKTGYQGIEPWIREIEQYRDGGGSLPDLKKRIADHGLRVESAIGFPNWAVEDESERAKGIETFKRDADLIAQLGGTHIAAPPAGINRADGPKLDLLAVAERYAVILKAGRDIGVIPMAEIWGPSKNMSRLGEAVIVAVESGDPNACVLPDIYHVYRGGSDFSGLKLLAGSAIPVFHVNDYPTDRPRTDLNDSDRVYVGDGKAPTDFIFKTLADNGCRAALSLELFNPGYWQQPAEQVLREGLEKTKAAVKKALA
jgi:2-keto-myo-inositol isomerase